MKDFLTDAEMEELEKTSSPDFLTDEEMEKLEKPNVSKMESFLRGGAQGATLGFGDELSALAEKGMAKAIPSFLGGMSSEEYQDVYGDKSYKDLRNENRAIDEEARKANPWTYGIGEFAGGILPAAATFGAGAELGAVAKGTQVLPGALQKLAPVAQKLAPAIQKLSAPKTLGQAALSGGTFGGIAGLGQTEDISNIPRTALDVGLGAGLGAGIGALTHGVLGPKSKKVDVPEGKPTVTEAIPEEKPFSWKEVEVKPEDQATGTIAGKKPEHVAYWKQNKKRIEENLKTHSLDTNADGALSKEIPGDLDAFDTHLSQLRNKGDELLEKSGVKLKNLELADMFNEMALELELKGRNISDSDLSTIAQLRKYASRILPVEEKTINGKTVKYPKIQDVDATKIKSMLRGLWNDYENAYKPGHVSSFDESVLKNVLGKINERLKKLVGPEYGDVMDQLSQDVEAKNVLTKVWKPDKNNVPQAPTWFKQNFVYQMQDSQFGNRPMTTNIMDAIRRVGKVSNKDYETIVRDNLVYGDLFPETAKGLQLGTETAQWAKAARKFLGPLEGMADSAKIAKDYLVNKALRGEGKVGPAAANIASKAIEGGKKALGVGQDLLTGARDLAEPLAKPSVISPQAVRVFNRAREDGELSETETFPPRSSSTNKKYQSGQPLTPNAEQVHRILSPSGSSGEGYNQLEKQGQRSTKESQIGGPKTLYPRLNPRYRTILENARKRGGSQAVAVTDYTLQQRFPDYKRARLGEE